MADYASFFSDRSDFIKANRIRSIEVKGVALINEGIRPEFIAIVNYGIIGLIQLELGYAEKRILLKKRHWNCMILMPKGFGTYVGQES